jgi:hypothetical protein
MMPAYFDDAQRQTAKESLDKTELTISICTEDVVEDERTADTVCKFGSDGKKSTSAHALHIS